MKLSFLLGATNLAAKIIRTASRDVFNTSGVLELINETTVARNEGEFSVDGHTISPGFKVGSRGYDVTREGGYPTIWVECPSGYSFKVAIDSRVDAILAESYP